MPVTKVQNYSIPVPLSIWLLEVDDQYIIETINNIATQPRWEKNGATYALEKACIEEWKSRYKTKPIPKIIAANEMVFAE